MVGGFGSHGQGVGVLDPQPLTVQARMLQEYAVKSWRSVDA